MQIIKKLCIIDYHVDFVEVDFYISTLKNLINNDTIKSKNKKQ